MLSHVAQNNFTSGELSEWLDPRVDFPKYNNGLSLCENAIVRPQGGVFGRGGTVRVAPCKFSSLTTRVIPFRFSKTQTYIIELGHLYFRVFVNYAPVTLDTSISNATLSPLGEIRITTSTAHGLTSGRPAIIEGVVGTTEANGRWEQISVISTTQFDLTGSAFVKPYVSGGTAKGVIEVTTGYDAADLRGIKYAQTGDTLYLTHEDYPPAKITRVSSTSFALSVVDFQDGPYFDKNTSPLTLDPSGSTGAITVTASAALFSSTHVGSLWRFSDAGVNWGYFEITGFTSSTLVNANVITTLPGGANPSASIHWREGLWSDAQGYPACVAVHEQSTIWAGSPGAPQTFVKSVTDSPEDMTPGTLDDDSAVYTVGSGEIDSIKWMKSIDSLVLGTEGNEISVSGDNDSGLTPTSVRVKPRTPHGSNIIDGVRVSDAVVFCQRTGKRVRSLSYQIQSDKFTAKDLGLLADHILEEFGLVDMAFQQERYSVIWGIREDGELIGITYLPDEDVIGWHRHPTYGDGAFQSVATVPSPTFDRDDVWFTTYRTLNGVVTQHVEYMEPTNYGLDCATIFTSAATTFSVPHLKGETVAVVADNTTYPNKVVGDDGLVTLPAATLNVRIGLPFTGKIRTMKPEQQLQGGGTTQGLPRRWTQMRVRVKDTLGLKIAGDQIPYRKSSDLLDTGLQPFTGDHIVPAASFFDEDGRVTIEQTLPLPWAVTGIFGKVDFGVD